MIICPWKDVLRYEASVPGLREAVEKINVLQNLETATYLLENGRFMVQNGTTKPTEGGNCEAHRQYLDVQYMIKGQEIMGWAPTEKLEMVGEFNEEKDVGFYAGPVELLRIPEGYCYIVFPEDAHMPNRHIEVPNGYTKIVVKLKIK